MRSCMAGTNHRPQYFFMGLVEVGHVQLRVYQSPTAGGAARSTRRLSCGQPDAEIWGEVMEGDQARNRRSACAGRNLQLAAGAYGRAVEQDISISMMRGPLGTVRTRPSTRSTFCTRARRCKGNSVVSASYHKVEEPALIGDVDRLGFRRPG